ncbi:EndoU domain-containing protein [Lysinibacillus xylanilyticus]|uniref:EndoU domain-containing protein n=1 Tax=Lysinibacillus xylanilyticus TaxID=582475 RepID=A0ABT4EMA3_9BACI|nr:EndoU domain-containing protein [Lysinibacillus xylanilyticus]MCY9546789.1 EndoU domain-containing protein [Lysinibacillus xylanilyticus]
MREVPQPDYDYDVKKIQKAYTKALKDVQNELNNLFLTDFESAQIIAVEKSIRNILSDIEKYGNEWSAVALTKSATEGIASTIYTLELTKSYEDALKIVKFNTVNRRFIAAAIANTQSDLLAIIQNMERQSKVAIRKATVEAMRAKLANGINATSDISKEIRERIINATGVAIIDARGNRWKVENYADVVARTNMMNAHREASINEALSEESYYGRISRHGAKDACSEYEGKIVKLVANAPGDYLYIGDIPRKKLFHPRCKHLISPLRDPEKYSRSNIPEMKPTESTLKHANLGDFTIEPRTQEISKMKSGGHGQDNISFLKENNIDYNIEKIFSNGVRIGNVPRHKSKTKKTGVGQSWFPENWTKDDIEKAGLHVANNPNNKIVNGFQIFGVYKNIEIGVFLNLDDNKVISTIFPTNKQSHLEEGD